mgnify:FL=1
MQSLFSGSDTDQETLLEQMWAEYAAILPPNTFICPQYTCTHYSHLSW